MSALPLVSVLVTVYNREQYLADCLESILRSTYDTYEIIVVDDASTDKSVDVAMQFASRDNRIRVERNDKNLSDYPNRMRAASLATGKYIKYVDSDDVIYPHSLAIMVEAMEANQEAALGITYPVVDGDRPYPWMFSPEEAWHREFLGEGTFGSGPTGAIIHRERFFETGGFGDWGVLSDTDMWYRLSARYPVLLLQPGLVWWRRHEMQEFTRDSAATFYLSRGFDLAISALTSDECPLTPAEKTKALNRARQHHARRIISLALRRGQPGLALRLMKQSGLARSEILKGLTPYQ
jgi:glycosyltransferase involved in cell wall biosynthesis